MTILERHNTGYGNGNASARGTLLAIGGAEDRMHDRLILRRFVELAGDSSARLAIIPTASSFKDAGEQYKRIFHELGAENAEVLSIKNRQDADSDRLAHILEESTGVFLTGGNQVRLASLIGGTLISQILEHKNRHGTPVAGTSAGASVMSTVMVAGGKNGNSPRQSMAQMSRGLGLIDSVIIDQHFTERNRVSRLVSMVSFNPELLGVGIDEDTAAAMHGDGSLEVIGRGSVLVVDGSQMISNIYQTRKRKAPTIANVTVHFLADGGRFDINDRSVIDIG